MIDRSDKEVALDDTLMQELLSLCKDIDKEDEEAYQEIIRVCSELEHFWKGNQYLFWDGSVHHTARELDEPDYEQFEQIVNIYKAHGESVIAALAMEVPNVAFYPADAKNPMDIATGEAYTKLSRIVAQENRAPLLLVKALATLFNGGLISGYNYHERSEKYGFVEINEIETETVDVPVMGCAVCGAPMQEGMPQCQQCGAPAQPIQIGTQPVENVIRNEMKQYPKGKEKLKVWGPPFVKVPMYIQCQDEAGYIRLSYEISLGMARSLYQQKFKKGSGDDDDYARQQRMAILYGGYEPNNLVTVKMYWIRPWYLYNIETDGVAEAIESQCKNGVFAVVIDKQIVKLYSESMDEHWTLSENPLYSYIYADPMGKALKPVQDKRNEEDKLVTETLRHGIPFTVADAEALDWQQFKKAQVKPGDIYPGKAPFGKSISDGFFTTKTATVPQEITQIAKRTEEAGQFVVGSYPSIYGGPSEGGSRTYAEYAMSRNQALQRLSVHWKTVTDWWTRMMERAVSSRAKNLDEDVNFTDKVNDEFVTILIKKAQINGGKIGRVVSESSERLPISWMQKKDQVMELFQLNSPEINSVLFHPENANLLAMLFGFPELFIPGSDQRLKQLNEIKELSEAEPIEQMPAPQPGMENMNPEEQMNPQPQMLSSVAIEPDVDDHTIHSEVCQAWLVSERGQILRRENPAAYQNIVAHKKEHDMYVQQQQQQMMEAQAQQQEQNKPNGQEKNNE